jgi:hypothetical protein
MVGAAAAVATMLGGCGSNLTLDDLNPNQWFQTSESTSTGAEGGFTVTRGPSEAATLAPAAAADFVGADGRCQGGSAEPGTAARPVMLTMTECELVAAAGVPEQVNIGADAGGERRAVLTYGPGDHPGIYTFVAGRLKVIERLPAAAKPEPRRRAPKKQRAKAQ